MVTTRDLPTLEGRLPNAARHSLPEHKHGIAPRREITYSCPGVKGLRAHSFPVVVANTATEIPDRWDCPRHGVVATADGTCASEPKRQKGHDKTHLEMLMERRKRRDLDALLTEVLLDMQSGGRMGCAEFLSRRQNERCAS